MEKKKTQCIHRRGRIGLYSNLLSLLSFKGSILQNQIFKIFPTDYRHYQLKKLLVTRMYEGMKRLNNKTENSFKLKSRREKIWINNLNNYSKKRFKEGCFSIDYLCGLKNLNLIDASFVFYFIESSTHLNKFSTVV